MSRTLRPVRPEMAPAIRATSVATLALLCLLPGCRPSRPMPFTAESEEVAADEAFAHQTDLFCEGDGQAWARRWILRSSLERTAASSFAAVTSEQREQRDGLCALPDLELEVRAMGPRLLIQIPENHPAGPAELLLADDLDRLVLFRVKSKQQVMVGRHRLAELLDTSPLVAGRSGFELRQETSVLEPKDRLPRSRSRLRATLARLALLYAPRPETTGGWSLRGELRVIARDEPPRSPVDNQILHLALPLFEAREGLPLLDMLGRTVGAPLRWTLTLANEMRPAGWTPALRTEIEDYGLSRAPLASFCLSRTGYTKRPALPWVERAGLQLASPSDLAKLRPGPSTGPLRVHNRSDHVAYIYADGVLLGWVAPGRQLALRGLPDGYYRIAARSVTAVRAWGPFDLYLPGPLTLP